MTKQTETETAVTVQPDLELEEYGNRDDIAALSRRIQTMLPGGDRLTATQSMAVAQAAILTDANPFRGEIYGFKGRGGQLVLVDGYKLLVRWAKRQMPYSEKYEILEHLAPEDIGYRCWILRQDQHATLQVLVQAGADFQEAFEIAATSAIGVVRKADTWSAKYQKEIDPPTGWTWEQVARKRALKNALNLSHGAPSPREIASDSWKVGDIETIAADWSECTAEMPPEARARLAAMTARTRQQEPDERSPEEVLKENGKILHGEIEEI